MDFMETIDTASEKPRADTASGGKQGADANGKRSAPDGGVSVPPPQQLTPKVVKECGLMECSDMLGWNQLCFHVICWMTAAALTKWCLDRRHWILLLPMEFLTGIVVSFLFNAFHEMVHNTAFATRQLNSAFAHVLGFLTFRGATWFWCFHWAHHRFTNDPKRDPELSGGSVDLDDPTRNLGAYLMFISGWPFGFERVLGMIRRGFLGAEHDPWVREKPEATQRLVRREAAFYSCGYLVLLLGALAQPRIVGQPMLLYWLLPHVLGSGHLRLYQFAEHRACRMGPYTDTNAWTCARTTMTWSFYKKLAWQMPYHIEHHAFPNVPFHMLEKTHRLVRTAYRNQGISSPPTGCDPDGSRGYSFVHALTLLRALGWEKPHEPATKEKVAPVNAKQD